MRYHNYIFLKPKESLKILSEKKRIAANQQFSQVLSEMKDIISYSYTTLGLKTQTNIMLWLQSDSPIRIQDLLNTLMHTELGQYVEITHTLFGMTRPTQYSSSQSHEDTLRKGGQYLIIYPFTKTHDWYMLDMKTRRELMKGHIAIGRKFPQITQLLLYSYGVDDQEFIVSYETDDLSAFQDLVMELRSDKVRQYTKQDTPIFTCIYRSLEKTLTFL